MASILVVWVASIWPADGIPGLTIPNGDKVYHFVAYATIAYLLWRGWPHWPVWLTWIVALLCGGAAEIAQALLTVTRHPDWLDMVANGAGALTGVLIGKLTARLASGGAR